MKGEEIKVKCKRCGRAAIVGEFILDPDYKMMVCPLCIKEKRMKKEVYAELAKEKKEGKEEKEKPAGWDKEDEYLERSYKENLKRIVRVKKIDDEKVSYKCPKCNYLFTYNIVKKTPKVCPYCSSNIFKIRFE